MRADDAISTTVELEIVRARVRDDLAQQASVRVPLLVFGVLTLTSAVIAAPGQGEWLGLYWLLAAPLGMTLVARHYRGLQRRAGVGGSGMVAFAVGGAMAAAAFAAGWLGGPAAAGCAIGGGYLAMAAVVRSWTMAILGIVLLLASAGVMLAGLDRVEVALPAAFGTALIVAGIGARA